MFDCADRKTKEIKGEKTTRKFFCKNVSTNSVKRENLVHVQWKSIKLTQACSEPTKKYFNIWKEFWRTAVFYCSCHNNKFITKKQGIIKGGDRHGSLVSCTDTQTVVGRNIRLCCSNKTCNWGKLNPNTFSLFSKVFMLQQEEWILIDS